MKQFRIVKDSPTTYRIDQRHSLLFGLIKFWDRGAADLCPNVRFNRSTDALHYIKEIYPKSHITLRYTHSEGY